VEDKQFSLFLHQYPPEILSEGGTKQEQEVSNLYCSAGETPCQASQLLKVPANFQNNQ
jgi:hypothetical protein